MSVRLTKLPNGMRVVTHAMPHLETVSLGIWVGAGARDEASHQHGISHLLEHMAFKGTERRTARQIAEEVEAAGGDLNAATSLETTVYYARVLKADVAMALGILADILRNPVFQEADLAREKEVIRQEIAASEDSPDEVVHDLVQEAAFQDQSIGRTILGTIQSVSKFASADLHQYRSSRYGADAMVLAAAGGVDHDSIVAMVERHFGGHGAGAASETAPAQFTGGLRCSAKQFEQSHIALAFEGPSYGNEAFFTAQVLNGILGGGISSRLFQEIRENRGLCYSIYSYSWALTDTGLFGVHAATGEALLPELMDVLRVELDRMASDVPSPSEVARAKAQLKAGLLMSLESSGARAEQLARQVLAFGKPLDLAHLAERVDAVDQESVRALAEELFAARAMSVALVGSPRWERESESLVAKFRPPTVVAAE